MIVAAGQLIASHIHIQSLVEFYPASYKLNSSIPINSNAAHEYLYAEKHKCSKVDETNIWLDKKWTFKGISTHLLMEFDLQYW